jgi:hypothetical protein
MIKLNQRSLKFSGPVFQLRNPNIEFRETPDQRNSNLKVIQGVGPASVLLATESEIDQICPDGLGLRRHNLSKKSGWTASFLSKTELQLPLNFMVPGVTR